MGILNALLIILTGIAILAFRRLLVKFQLATLTELNIATKDDKMLGKILIIIACIFGLFCIGLGITLLVSRIS
jgi:hypothetical protein